MPLSGRSEASPRQQSVPHVCSRPVRMIPGSALTVMIVSTLMLLLSTAIDATPTNTATNGIPTLYHFEAMSRGIEPLDKSRFVQSYAEYYQMRQQMRNHASGVASIDDLSGADDLGRHLEETEQQMEFTEQCVSALMSPSNTDDRLISQVEFVDFLNELTDEEAKELMFHNLYWTTQVKFVWGICTNRDQTHDSSEVDECLNDLEASGNDRSDGEFGFKLRRNGKNEEEIRTQVADMCSDVYADVVRQGIVGEDDISNNAETGGGDGGDDDKEEGGTDDNDGTGPTTDPSPVASPTEPNSVPSPPVAEPTEPSAVPSPVASPTAAQPTASADNGSGGLTLAPVSFPTAPAMPTSPSVPSLGPSDDAAPATAPAVDPSTTSSPVGSPTTVSADDLDIVLDDDTTDTVEYFDVFFTYRMDFSDESMNAETVESEYDSVIKSTVALVLRDEGVSRRLALSLSSAVTDPIENVNYADSSCPEEEASDAENKEAVNSCVFVVSLVRVEAEKDTEDQNSANSAIQTPLRVSMAPISNTFEDTVGIDGLVRVEWISGAPGQDATVSLGTDGTSDSRSLSNGGIAALSVCLTVLLAGGLFALSRRGDKSEDDESGYHDVDDVEAQELRSASVSKDLSPAKPIATGFQPKDGDASIDHDVEIESLAASAPQASGERTAEGSGDWAACGATAAILASTKTNIGDDLSSIAPSSRVSTPLQEEDRAGSVFAELLFDLPPQSLSTSHPSQEGLAGLVALESVPQLSPQGEALNCTRSLGGSSSAASEATPATVTHARSSDSLSGVVSNLNSTANSSPTKNGPTFGYTGIAMAGVAAAGATMVTSNRDEDDQSFDGSFISDKPSEADNADRLVASKSTLVPPEQKDALNRIDAALNSGDWAAILTEANVITENDDNQSLMSDMSSLRANFVATSAVDRSNLSQADAKKAAHIDSLIAHGDWNKVGEAASQYEEEASAKKSVDVSDEASQKTTASAQSFLGRLFGGGANDDTNGGASTAAGAVVAGTAVAAAAVASSSSDNTTDNPKKSTNDIDNGAQEDIALAPTQSSEGSPNVSSPPNDSSPDSQASTFATNPYLTSQRGESGAAAMSLSSLFDHNVSISDNNSHFSADLPLIADKDTKRKKSPKNLFGLGSKKSSPSNVQPSGEYDDDATPKASWKRKLGFGGKSKSASDAIDNLAMLEDSSVESRSLGSDAMNAQEDMRSSLPSDIASSISGVAAVPRSDTPVNAGSFAAAALPPPMNAATGNDISSDIYASSASASVPTDNDADDAISHRSFVDDLDVAIETGNWAAVEEAAANMLDGASSSDASSHIDGGISSAASSDFHSAGSHLSSSHGGSSIGGSSVNTDKIKALEHAIENNNWQRVLELSGKYKKEVSEDGESPKGAAAAAAWAIDRSFQSQIGEDEEVISDGDEV